MILNEEFSDLDDEPTPSTSSPQPQPESCFQKLTVGHYVLVNYEGELDLGHITEMRNNDEILITAMKKSRVQIVHLINLPQQLSQRAFTFIALILLLS